MDETSVPFKVLLIGGVSGVGKSATAVILSRRLGIPWLQVDDLRPALQCSGLVAREAHSDLFHFLDRSDWHITPEEYRDKLIAVGQIITGALRIVVESHLHHDASPVIIEGDGILPAFAATVREAFGREAVRALFVVEHDATALLTDMLKRGRGIEQHTADEQQTEACGKALFSEWLEGEARRLALPTIRPVPWDTLTERVMEACSTESR
jgi:2-phosphoglycerate kinase